MTKGLMAILNEQLASTTNGRMTARAVSKLGLKKLLMVMLDTAQRLKLDPVQLCERVFGQCAANLRSGKTKFSKVRLEEIVRDAATQILIVEEHAELELSAREPDLSPPLFAVVWDPSVVTDNEYAELVGAVGDLVRAHGGAGVRRLQEFDIEVEARVLQP